ncbi:hypothetical protein [Phyllobacterium sp. SB3]|uniref:hypothetical protein n=1 Tax=Phyllobacterium sp. SB3 TaxID=3156073 RepID=UPI0032AFCE60
MVTPFEKRAARVERAAIWLATTPRDFTTPAVVLLRDRFDLTALEACEAIAEARLISARSL